MVCITLMNNTEINTSRTTTVHTPDRSTVESTTNHSEVVTSNRSTVINTLAVVGFVVLIGAGIWLAVYSTRLIPGVVNGIGDAAVYLGAVFNPASVGPALSVVPTPSASTTISFGTTVSRTDVATTDTTATTTVVKTTQTTTTPAKPIQTAPGASTNTTYQVGSGPTTVTPYGLSDLTVTIGAVGYLVTTSTDSFVGASVVPSGSRPAVKFTIKNIGTNWTGTWRFSASIPTQTAYVFESDPQQSLAPGESIDYTLGFDQALSGPSQLISITANFDHAATDSNLNNNNITAYFTIL